MYSTRYRVKLIIIVIPSRICKVKAFPQVTDISVLSAWDSVCLRNECFEKTMETIQKKHGKQEKIHKYICGLYKNWQEDKKI